MSTFFQPRWWMRSRLSQHFYDSATSDSLTISSSPSPLRLVVFTPFGRIWWLDAHSTYWSVPRVIFPYTFRLLFWISHSRVSWFLSYVFLSKSSFERRVKKNYPQCRGSLNSRPQRESQIGKKKKEESVKSHFYCALSVSHRCVQSSRSVHIGLKQLAADCCCWIVSVCSSFIVTPPMIGIYTFSHVSIRVCVHDTISFRLDIASV